MANPKIQPWISAGTMVALRIFILSLCALEFTQAQTVITPDQLTPRDISSLEARARSGNAESAYQLWMYYECVNGDRTQTTLWLRTAAKLGHPEAQRWLAYKIREQGADYSDLGKTPQEAVESLLKKAAATNGSAANDLGDCYREGYLNPKDRKTKAREAYTAAAALGNTTSWESLAEMLFKGEGGPADPQGGYYYVVLCTRWIHPDSVTGKELWNLRRKIEAKLPLAKMEEIWDRADILIKKERTFVPGKYQPGALNGFPDSKTRWRQEVKETDARDLEHRRELAANWAKTHPQQSP